MPSLKGLMEAYPSDEPAVDVRTGGPCCPLLYQRNHRGSKGGPLLPRSKIKRHTHQSTSVYSKDKKI